jgi:hypothetical protein
VRNNADVVLLALWLLSNDTIMHSQNLVDQALPDLLTTLSRQIDQTRRQYRSK